eukprot:412130-Rhodomonas_salina.1
MRGTERACAGVAGLGAHLGSSRRRSGLPFSCPHHDLKPRVPSPVVRLFLQTSFVCDLKSRHLSTDLAWGFVLGVAWRES